jgi:hypothetical protein
MNPISLSKGFVTYVGSIVKEEFRAANDRNNLTINYSYLTSTIPYPSS